MVLTRGRTVRVRPVQAQDANRHVALRARLSPETIGMNPITVATATEDHGSRDTPVASIPA